MEDLWFSRDLLVLKAVVAKVEKRGHADTRNLRIDGLTEEDIKRALKSLADGGFFTDTESSAGGRHELVWGVTGEARRAIGAWPSPENLVDRLVEQMRLAAEAAEDEETSSRLRRTAAWFGGVGRDLMVEITAAAITRGVGLG